MNYQNYIPHQKLTPPTDKKIVLVGGCFDILHYGHIQFLQKAKNIGDYLIVALEPDERIIQSKNRQPIHNQQERAYNLLALRFVDYVLLLPLLNGFGDYLGLVEAVKPHSIAVTDGDPQINNKKKQAEIVNAQLVIVTNRIEPFSSSMIYQKNDFEYTQNLLD